MRPKRTVMDAVLLVSQASNGALSGRRYSAAGAASFNRPAKLGHPFSSRSRLGLHSINLGKPLHLSLLADGEPGPSSRTNFPPFPAQEDDTFFVGDEGAPLEGVIQFDKLSARPPLLSWVILALLSGGDILCLLAFSALGRFSHGLPVLDFETLKSADPFIAGWMFSAYFLGGYGDEGKGFNGYGRALAAAGRSWVVGIPVGELWYASSLLEKAIKMTSIGVVTRLNYSNCWLPWCGDGDFILPLSAVLN